MGLVIKHSIRFSIIYYLGVVLGYVNTVLLFPNILNPEEFGLTRILLSVAIVISQFAQFGSPSMVVRFFPKIKEKIFGIGLTICTISTMVFLGLMLLFKQHIISLYEENAQLFTEHFMLLIPFSIAIVYFNLFDAYLRVLYKNSVSTFMSNILLRLIWMGLILLFSSGLIDFELFIYLYSLSYAVITLILLAYIRFLNKKSFSFSLEQNDKTFLREIRSFNFFTLLAGLSSFLINKVDIIMLGSLESLEVLGIYAIAAYMGSVIRVPASSIARTAQIIVSDSFKKNDLPSIKTLYKKSSITQLMLSAGVFLLILINYNNITYLLPDEYSSSMLIFLLLGLTQVIDSSMGVNGFIMINSPYFKYETLFSSFLLIMTVVGNYFFIPLYGAVGAAIATLLSISLYNLCRLFFISSKYKMIPFTTKTALAILICILSFLAVYFIPAFDFFIWDALIRSLIWAMIFIPLTYYTKVSPDINAMINSIINLLKSRFVHSD